MDNKHMNLEQAYWQVKGRKLSEKMKDSRGRVVFVQEGGP